jgi:polyhydroxybutyrate depolymerase
LPTLYIIGLEDPLVPFEGGSIRSPWGEFRNQPSVQDSLAKWAAALGCPAQARDLGLRDGVHSLVYGPGHNGPELLVKLVEGQGHHWPGGAGGWSEAMAGKMTSHIDATHAIWSFFAGHQLEVS